MSDGKLWRLLGYQRRWVNDHAQVKVCSKGRRIGITFAEASDNVLHAAEGRGNIYYQNPSKELTKEYIETCQDWAASFEEIVDSIDEQIVEEDGREKTLYTMRFASGKRISAITSSASQFRGKGKPGDIGIIDEAAFHRDLAALLKAALAFTIWGGKVRIISTHNGADNPFNILCEDARTGRKPYSFHQTTFDEALADGLAKRICDVTGRAWSPEAGRKWADGIRAIYKDNEDEELNCIPSTGAGAWIAGELLVAATDKGAGIAGNYAGGPVWIGNDIARRDHQWVAIAVEKIGRVAWVREERVLKNAPFAQHDAAIAELISDYKVSRLVMDQTGIGERSVEMMQNKYGKSRVEGLLMNPSLQLDIATAAREMFEEGLVRLPDDPTLRAEIRGIKKTTGPTGKPRLVTEHSADGHSDRAWALFYALAGLSQPKPNVADCQAIGTTAVTAGLAGFAGPSIDAGIRGYL